MSTQPTEAHHDLADKVKSSRRAVGALLICDSEARAVEAATASAQAKSDVLTACFLSQAIEDRNSLNQAITAERKRVRVLEEAAKPFIEYAKAYGACTGSELWAPNGTKLKPRDWLTLAATKEGSL